MIEPNNCWEGIVNGVNSEEFANILNILDFPMESLEGDGGVGDLEPHNFQSMGPIPLDALAGVPLVSQSQFDCGPEVKGSIRNAPVNIKSELIDPTYRGIYNNGSNTPSKSFMSPKFRTFETPSPVSILENSGSCSSVKCSITKPEIAIPGRVRSKRKRPSNLHSWFRTSPIICSDYVANRSADRGNNKDLNKQKLTSSSNVSAGLPGRFYAIRKKATTLDKQSLSTKKCTHCQVSKTPQWREGPLGPKTLCNACGVRYRSGRLLPEYRPASSPTFVPSFHSNSHRKVLQMRMKATQHDIEAPPMSPPPEFVPRSNYLFDPFS